MNNFATIQKFPKTDQDCQKECDLLETVFERRLPTSSAGCCFDLAMYRHFGSTVRLTSARLGLAFADLAENFHATEFGWFRHIRDGLPFVLLFGNDSQIELFAEKFPIDTDPNMTTPLEYQMPMLYLLVCNELCRVRQPSEQVEEKIAKSRKKNPIQFLKVFQAAVRGNQAEYDTALVAGLKHYQGLSESYLDATIAKYICRELTSINLMAERLGKKCPDLPEELGACLMTKASVGC